jgi:glucose/arabinose dehydrogenase
MTLAQRHVRYGSALASVALMVAMAATTIGAEVESDQEAAASPAVAASGAPGASPALIPAFDAEAARIRIDLLVDGLDAPVFVTDDGTGKACIYIVERGGTVRVTSPGDAFVRPKPFLDISALVKVGAEQGLHAIAFHPDFRKNGRLFAHYNDVKTGASVIAEFKGKPCQAANSKPVKPLRLSVEQLRPNNNGGWIGFGPDGYLYVALGDGGGLSPGDPDGIGQSRSTRLSKILRIDVDRGRGAVVPKSNPYAKKKRGFDPLTWAWGLRDPRRASFDRKTGDLWIGDVGQDRYEEVNRIPAGATEAAKAALNFGWSDMEGDRCHNLPDCDVSAYEPPVHFYDKAPPHDDITGGYVYRGESMPDLLGVYLFSDVNSGFIWGIDADAVADGDPAIAYPLVDAPQGIVSFGEDDAGELYAAAADGSIYRIEADGS